MLSSEVHCIICIPPGYSPNHDHACHSLICSVSGTMWRRFSHLLSCPLLDWLPQWYLSHGSSESKVVSYRLNDCGSVPDKECGVFCLATSSMALEPIQPLVQKVLRAHSWGMTVLRLRMYWAVSLCFRDSFTYVCTKKWHLRLSHLLLGLC
jgi:hypothetical protein